MFYRTYVHVELPILEQVLSHNVICFIYRLEKVALLDI
jgi:hypothetical protein